MVNPTGSSPGNLSGNIAGSAPLPGLRLQAGSPDTIRFLAENAGKLINARVVDVLVRSTSSAPPAAGSNTVQGNAVKSDAAPAPAQPRSGAQQAGANATQPGRMTEKSPQQNAQYEVRLAVGQKTLTLLAALAPRQGQYLQLSVNNSQQVQVVNASTVPLAPGGANPAAASAQANPAAAIAQGQASSTAGPGSATLSNSAPAVQATANTAPQGSALPGAATYARSTQQVPLSNTLNSALRDALPRQLSRADLASALAQLANNGQAAQATASSRPGQSGIVTAPGSNAALAPGIATTNRTDTQLQPGPAAKPAPVTVSATTGTGTPSLAPGSAAALQNLVAAIATASELTSAEGVKRALLDSGLFYEHKLANAAAALRSRAESPAAGNAQKTAQDPAQSGLRADALARLEVGAATHRDLKHALLQVLAGLSQQAHAGKAGAAPAPDDALLLLSAAELARPAEQLAGQANRGSSHGDSDALMQLLRLALGATARIQTQQLFSLNSQVLGQADPALNQVLSTELPLWLDQRLSLLDLRVEREPERRKAGAQSATWNVRLRFDLDELGELTALASLHGKRMAAVLWSSTSELAQRVEKELASMGEQLLQLGLQVQNLQCCVGEAPSAGDGAAVNLLHRHLLDTQG